ncbi:hypothetical protein [Microbacterium album]|uniref:Uncharacterized protein n=1 Tax=Microbacterium album TaxID=2053191 RepID=A0A917MKK7_9MICO|nr:hypothetical protein [Microbacterium album]GGH35273.1 hypothetical protein GCM10010921_03570 [Microbacterium album]
MEDTTGSEERPMTAAALTHAYRAIRCVEPPQAPVRGLLAAQGDRRVLLADIADAAPAMLSGGAGASAAASPQHVLVPLDLVRRPDGHDVELPWCRERLDRLMAARATAGPPLSGGELVTLTVSVLRGTCEAWARGPQDDAGPRGVWWVTEEGRPMFAADREHGEPAEVAARGILGLALEQTSDRVLVRSIEEARAALERPRGLARTLQRLEDALFDACAPQPVQRPHARDAVDAADSAPDVRATASAPPPALLTGLIERFVDAGVAELVRDALDRLRDGARRLLAGRRRAPLVVGGAAAALVLVGGALWPSDAGPAAGDALPASAETGTVGGDRSQPGGAEGGALRDEDPARGDHAERAGEDPVAATGRLLAEVAACAAAGDDSCGRARDVEAEPVAEEALEAASVPRDVHLLDDYGDVAVTRADDPSGERAALLVQLVRLDGRWLLRAVHPLAGADG